MKHELMIETKTVEETQALGEAIGRCSTDGLFLALVGDLGAGKTHFVQGLARGLGVSGVVASPTFTIMNLYEGRLPLKHFDFYRLKRADELYDIGWDEYGAGGVVVAEWADLFPEVIPPEALQITLLVTGENQRQIRVEWTDASPESVVKEIAAYAACH